MRKKNYQENGVAINKPSLKPGDEAKLVYSGLLKSSGASQVKAHIGYNDNWESCATLDMTLVDDKFEADISLLQAGTFHCAFVDPLGNWDNNSGENYSFKVSKPVRKKAEIKDEPQKSPVTKTAKAKGVKAKKEKAEENDKKRIKSA